MLVCADGDVCGVGTIRCSARLMYRTTRKIHKISSLGRKEEDKGGKRGERRKGRRRGEEARRGRKGERERRGEGRREDQREQ